MKADATRASWTAQLGAAVVCALASAAPSVCFAADDPLSSPVWKSLSTKILGTSDVVYDDRVKVVVPPVVENQAQVPVSADARGLPNVEKIIVIADLNPIQHVLTFTPAAGRAAPYVSLRLKVEQATPVRAAALTSDGVWHVGGVLLEAAGGGCSSPAMAREDADWSKALGESQGRIWRDADGQSRLRLRIRHPMDTGLSKDNTPAFFIEQIAIKDQTGAALGSLELFEPVSEDPTLTLMLNLQPSSGAVTIDGRDNNGTILRSVLRSPWSQSGSATASPGRL
ncbi:MAG: quinoprotein dehydrogenase-associated SoxYZ-like carrier [Hyphomicrobium sp.]